eukprot:6183146-Pleurochrysis_carterae.AAC.2
MGPNLQGLAMHVWQGFPTELSQEPICAESPSSNRQPSFCISVCEAPTCCRWPLILRAILYPRQKAVARPSSWIVLPPDRPLAQAAIMPQQNSESR